MAAKASKFLKDLQGNSTRQGKAIGSPSPKKIASIVKKITDIQEPTNYYIGTPEMEFILPQSILIMGRHSGKLPSVSNLMHYRFLLAINLKGHGNVIVDGTRYSLPPLHSFLIFPNQSHHFLYETTNLKWIFIAFELKKYEHIEEIRNSLIVLSDKAMQFLDLIITTYVRNKTLSRESAEEAILLLQLLLQELKKSQRFIGNHCSETLVDHINQFIYANTRNKNSITKIAEHFAYSPSHLRAIYRQAMGISIGQYIKDVKITKAQYLLGTTDLSIAQISEECGYDSMYSFSHAFKNFTNFSPTAYKKKITRKDTKVRNKHSGKS